MKPLPPGPAEPPRRVVDEMRLRRAIAVCLRAQGYDREHAEMDATRIAKTYLLELFRRDEAAAG